MGCATVYKNASSTFHTLVYVKFAVEHDARLSFVIRPAGHGAITRASEWGFINWIRSNLDSWYWVLRPEPAVVLVKAMQ